MIIRCWRAVAGSDEVLAAYADHLRKTTFVGVAQLPGHLRATLARKVKGSDNELVVMSFRDDMTFASHSLQGGFDDAVVKPTSRLDRPDALLSRGPLDFRVENAPPGQQ